MTVTDAQEQGDQPAREPIEQRIEADIQKTYQKVKEITLLLQQSQVEVDRLTQRNAGVTSRLQQMLAQLDSTPREDIRGLYDEALDAQQRLVVMRGQVEKLESEKVHLEAHLEMLRSVREVLEGGITPKATNGTGTPLTAEMMVEAQETERHRLSRRMHDGPAQALSNFILLTEIALRMFDMDQEKARDELVNLKATASSTFQQIRDFIFDLRPMMLDDLGLIPTIRRYTDAFREKFGIDVQLSITGSERRLEPFLEVMIFRAVQELLNNAMLHGQATEVKVQIDLIESSVTVSVEDDGRGFDPDEKADGAGMGLKLIRDRIRMLDGDFMADSAPGQGARISFSVPSQAGQAFA